MSAKKIVREIKTGVNYRTCEFTRESINAEKRTVSLSISSEEPVRRWNWDIGEYDEILDHLEKSVDLSRLNNMGAVLDGHDTRVQVGVLDSVSLKGKKLH